MRAARCTTAVLAACLAPGVLAQLRGAAERSEGSEGGEGRRASDDGRAEVVSEASAENAASAEAAASWGRSPPPGCVRVERLVVRNQCSDELIVKGWSQRVAPGEEVALSGWRWEDLARLSWRLAHGPWDYDYIELNGNLRGAGDNLCAHPNYATWYGFTTSSRYEALDPKTMAPACADAGAEVDFDVATCPTGPSDRYACDFHATMESIMDCRSATARYQEARTFTINGDNSRTPRYNCGPGYSEWCGIFVNYPCAPESRTWPGYRIGSWIDCTNLRKSIVFKLTVCL